MDPRYVNAPILNRRRDEWNPETVRDYISRLFKKIELIDGWKFVSCNWGKSSKYKKEELKRHLLRNIQIKILNPREREITYNLQVPELVHNQFFHIGGYLKIPMFQLYDSPIIFRKNFLKLRTNTVTINMNLKKGYELNIFNRNVPIDILLTTAHTEEELEEFMTPLLESPIMAALYDKCLDTWDTSTQAERIKTIGNLFSTRLGDQVKKGEGVIFSLKAAYETDIFNKPLFQTNSILFEIIKALSEGIRSDTDINRKRIRFTEYVLSGLVKKIYTIWF